MYIRLNVTYRYSCQILMELEFSRQIFEKKRWNIKLHENPSRGEPIYSVRTDRQTDRQPWRSK